MSSFRPSFSAALVALACLAALPAPSTAADPAVEAARAWREAHGPRILREYAELLAIPNVASDTENIVRNAEAIAGELDKRGVATTLWRLDGEPAAPPIVHGRLDVPGATRTLGIYVHYDGQPVDPSQWTDPPWTPTLRTASLEDGGARREWPLAGEVIDPEWRIYARGAGDDKAPLPALFAALDALRNAKIPLTSNLLFFFEGEEEAGSPHLGAYMRQHRDALEADAWLIFDGPVHQSRRPQLVFGVRGVVEFDLTVYGATRYLHSGHYGNWSPNPAMLLARLLASMKNDAGDVVIEGFYQSTAPITDADRAALATMPPIDDALRRELGLAPGATEGDGASLMERLMLPSLNVRGIESAAVGEKARNVIPTRATASVDIRLAKGDDPAALLDRVEEHLRAQGYHVVAEEPDMAARLAHPRLARMVRGGGYRAVRTAIEGPLIEGVIAAARRAAGDRLVLVPTLGGSLPLYLFVDLLEAPVVIVPIANHDDNQHAPDENLRLANLWDGIELMAALLTME